MGEVVVIRHGETAWNRDEVFRGRADVPLSERGREQAQRLAGALAGRPIEAVYSSPLCRARETAEGLPGAETSGRRQMTSRELWRAIRQPASCQWTTPPKPLPGIRLCCPRSPLRLLRDGRHLQPPLPNHPDRRPQPQPAHLIASIM